VIQSWIA